MKRRKWTKEERKQIYQKYKGHCAYCGLPITIQEMQVDHIVALKRGGYTRCNTQPELADYIRSLASDLEAAADTIG